MPEQRSWPGSPRARPLAELAFDGPLDRVGELSRGWAVALIAERPPEAIGGAALADLARESPALLSALLKALRSDDDLSQLLEGARSGVSLAARIPALSGADGPVAVVAAIEALRGVVWEALLDEFGHLASEPGRARRLTDLADRLAGVCAAMLPAALEGIVGPVMAPVAPARPMAFMASGEALAPTEPVAAPAATPATVVEGELEPARVLARSVAVIVDERAAPGAEGERPEEPAATPPAEPGPPETVLDSEIQIRDERGDEGPAAWTRSIGRQLERFEHDQAPFAVLLVELRGAVESSWDSVEELISAELRGGTMTRERAGRYWLLSPATDRLGAGALAARVTQLLEELIEARGMGLSVAVGTAVCPEDGRRASALAAHADVGLYAARSTHHQAGPPRVAPTFEA